MHLISDPVNDNKNHDRIARLHPFNNFQMDIHKLIRICYDEHKIYIRITQGLRTIQEQNDLYALGRTKPGKIVTNAKGGYSWHNFGLAFDFTIIKDNKAFWDTEHPDWIIVQAIGRQLGFKQTTISNKGKTWIDAPHFEWHPDTTLHQCREMMKEAENNMYKFYTIYKNFLAIYNWNS